MRCPQCGGAVPGPGAACERCALASACLAPAARIEPMLARAHLLRMRGRWAEAADQCVEVLRLDPGNSTAHSLLGDIYQDQGRLEEARHWFQLALELNPSSDADRAKLCRAEESLEARQQRSEWEAVIQGRSQPVSTPLLLRESLQRVAALAGAALCGIILVMALLVSLSEGNRGGVQETTANVHGLFDYNRPRVNLADTPQEGEMLRKLQALPTTGPGRVVRVQLDPPSRSAEVRVYLTARARQSAGDSRFLVMREGYRYARALRELDRALLQVRVIVMGPASLSALSRTDALFRGVLTAQNLVVAADTVTEEELEQFYSAGVPAPSWPGESAGM